MEKSCETCRYDPAIKPYACYEANGWDCNYQPKEAKKDLEDKFMGTFDKPTEEEVNEGYRRMDRKIREMSDAFLGIVWKALKEHPPTDTPYNSSCGEGNTYKFVPIPMEEWTQRIYSEMDLRGIKH